MTRLYLDTADLDAAAPLLDTGVFHGLTTNPLLLERAGLTVADVPRIHDWALTRGLRETFFQTWGTTSAELLDRGRTLRQLGPDVIVKVPATAAGFAAARRLVDEGTPVLLTAVYNAAQVVAATSIGAQYIAPYLGRMTEAGLDGLAIVSTMQQIVAASNAAAGHTVTELIVASLRTVDDVVTLAARGAATFTIAPAVAQRLFEDDLATAAVADFERAARR